MRNITIKNIPEDLYEKIKRNANANRRSLNQEIIVCIEKSVMGEEVAPEQLINNARRLRKKTASHYLKNEELNQIKGYNRL